MKNTWVLSIRTSLPEVCESHEDLHTSIYTFDSFEEARAALRKVLKKYAFSENSMFDGKGNIIYFKKEVDEFVEWEQKYCNDEESSCEDCDFEDCDDASIDDYDYEDDYYDDELTAEKLVSINENLLSIFRGEDVYPELLPKGENLMFGYLYENGVLSTYSGYDGQINGCDPVINTNMFSMKEPQNYYCVGVTDLGAPCGVCEMCGYQIIRYVHHMVHNNYSGTLNVGCICAGKMEGDIEKAKKRERDFKNRESRRENFMNRKWNKSKNGNPYIKIKNHIIVLYKKKGAEIWKYSIDNEFCPEIFKTQEEAMQAVFEALEQLANARS